MELVLLRVLQVSPMKADAVAMDGEENLFTWIRNNNKKVTVIDRAFSLQSYIPAQHTPRSSGAFKSCPPKEPVEEPLFSSLPSLSPFSSLLSPAPTPPLKSSSSAHLIPNLLTTCACTTDDEIVSRVGAHVASDHIANFIFTQLHSLEDYFARIASSSSSSSSSSPSPATTSLPPDAVDSGLLPTGGLSFEDILKEMDDRVGRIYEALPPHSLFIAVTGRGPIIDIYRLQKEKQNRPGGWTKLKDRMLCEAVQEARKGKCFWAVKPLPKPAE